MAKVPVMPVDPLREGPELAQPDDGGVHLGLFEEGLGGSLHVDDSVLSGL